MWCPKASECRDKLTLRQLGLQIVFACCVAGMACSRVETRPDDERPDIPSSQLDAFASLNDQLTYDDAGYGASIVIDDADGLSGSVAFQAIESGGRHLNLMQWRTDSGNLEVQTERLAEQASNSIKMVKFPGSELRAIAAGFLAEGGTAFLGLMEETSPGTWQQRILDENQDNARFLDMQADTEGALHIAYLGPFELRYMVWQDGVFLTQPSRVVSIDNGIDGNEIGPGGNISNAVSLAFLPDGVPIVSYYDGTNGQLRVAYQDKADFSWKIQVVGRAIRQAVIVPDADGVVTLVDELIPRKSQIRVYENLAAISEDRITVVDRSRIKIVGAAQNAEYLIDYISPVSIDYGSWSSLAVAADGSVGVGFFDFRGGRMMYASNGDVRASDVWTVETVDSRGIVGGVNRLASLPLFDNSNVQRGEFPVVVYQDIGNSDLLMAYRKDGNWNVNRLVSRGLTGFGASIATAADNWLVIAYREHRVGDVFRANLQVLRALPVSP